VVITIDAAILPRPLTFDTDKPSGEGGIPSILRPHVEVLLKPGTDPVATWGTSPSSHLPAFLLLAGVAVVLALAVAGASK
jgi:hypothetical protein